MKQGLENAVLATAGIVIGGLITYLITATSDRYPPTWQWISLAALAVAPWMLFSAQTYQRLGVSPTLVYILAVGIILAGLVYPLLRFAF